MEGMDAGVMDTPEVETPELETDIESPELESAEPEQAEAPEQAAAGDSEDPFSTRNAREYRQWLNNLKADPNNAKFVKQARDDFGRVFAINKLGGIDGIREKLSALDVLSHGELKGPEAIAAMQESIREAEEVDGLIANGDPRAFDTMGPEFDAGLAKLAPAYLDRLAKNPEAYQAAILPHVVGLISGSQLIADFNGAVDEMRWRLGDRQLNQLNEQEIRQFAATAIKAIGGVSNGFNALGQQAQQAKTSPQADPKASEFEQQRTQFEQERQAHHWGTKIEPLVVAHNDKLFKQYFEPYQKRLKLNDAGQKAMAESFKKSIIAESGKDQAFVRQYKAFKSQKSPDPNTVANYVNAWMGQRAKAIIDAQVSERYGNFLAGKPKAAPVQQKGAVASRGPVGPNVEIRTVKPHMSEIDHRNTPVDWLAQKKYRLYSGKVVQVRAGV